MSIKLVLIAVAAFVAAAALLGQSRPGAQQPGAPWRSVRSVSRDITIVVVRQRAACPV